MTRIIGNFVKSQIKSNRIYNKSQIIDSNISFFYTLFHNHEANNEVYQKHFLQELNEQQL
jgi:hypothetical protein